MVSRVLSRLISGAHLEYFYNGLKDWQALRHKGLPLRLPILRLHSPQVVGCKGRAGWEFKGITLAAL